MYSLLNLGCCSCKFSTGSRGQFFKTSVGANFCVGANLSECYRCVGANALLTNLPLVANRLIRHQNLIFLVLCLLRLVHYVDQNPEPDLLLDYALFHFDRLKTIMPPCNDS
jgi:hypothetical protein